MGSSISACSSVSLVSSVSSGLIISSALSIFSSTEATSSVMSKPYDAKNARNSFLLTDPDLSDEPALFLMDFTTALDTQSGGDDPTALVSAASSCCALNEPFLATSSCSKAWFAVISEFLIQFTKLLTTAASTVIALT